MIQLNLLPDIKLAYVRARRLRRTVVVIAAIIAGSCLTAMVLLLITVQVVQTKYLNDLNKDIATNTKKLESSPNLNKILTIQNQLNNLTPLHDQKPVATRINKYIQQVTPKDVSIASINLDFVANKMTVTGKAASVALVNQYVDTYKFTTYKTATTGDSSPKAFSQVVLTSYSLPTATTGTTAGASYTITLSFDPIIFNNKEEVQLVVPTQITTRSETEKPTLFQPAQDGGSQ